MDEFMFPIGGHIWTAGRHEASEFFLSLVASFLSDGATRSLFRKFLCVHIQRRASMAEGRGWEVQVQRGVAHTTGQPNKAIFVGTDVNFIFLSVPTVRH